MQRGTQVKRGYCLCTSAKRKRLIVDEKCDQHVERQGRERERRERGH